MPKQVNIYEAKTQLSALLSDVEHGEDVVIARNGRPVARLTRIADSPALRTPGAWRGKVRMSDDFDELDEQTLADWYGK